MKHKYSAIIIEWEDSQISPQGWERVSDFIAQIPIMKSIGFIVYEDKNCISIASSLGMGTKTSDEQICNTITIPKRSIVSKHFLK